MTYTRTSIATGLPVSNEQIAAHIRLDADLLTEAPAYIAAAAAEVEAYCAVALLDQTITATTDQWPGRTIALPVGPVAADAVATVALVELDGSTTPITAGWWLEGGRYPRLHFTSTEPGGRLRIAYPAGYGNQPETIPGDLRHAVADLAARLYDMRGADDGKATMPPAAARILARHRRVAL